MYACCTFRATHSLCGIRTQRYIHGSKIFHNRNQFIIGSYALLWNTPKSWMFGWRSECRHKHTHTRKKYRSAHRQQEKQCQENEITFARLTQARISLPNICSFDYKWSAYYLPSHFRYIFTRTWPIKSKSAQLFLGRSTNTKLGHIDMNERTHILPH